MKAKIAILCLFLGIAITATPAMAEALNASENSKICLAAIAQEEAASKIPKNVLKAIAHTESGRFDKKSKAFSAWPWTVNSGGKGYYFDTKLEAVNFVRDLQLRGVKSIDVGCMQINLHHHKNAFQSVEEAFDPESNVGYAAEFLNGLHRESGSWLKAIGNYHSATPFYHEQYKKRVLARLDSINTGKKLVQETKTAVYRPKSYYNSTAELRQTVRYTGLTVIEADAKRKALVMKAWEERQRKQAAKLPKVYRPVQLASAKSGGNSTR